MCVYGVRQTGTTAFVEILTPADATEWTPLSETFYFGPTKYSPGPKTRIEVALMLSSRGRADFADIQLARVEPHVAQINEWVREETYGPKHVVLDINDGSHRVRLIPQAPQNRTEPVPTTQQETQGFVRFVPASNAGVLPQTIPSAAEIEADPKRFAARGESEVITFCLRPLQDLGILTFELSPLEGPGGGRIETSRCELYIPVGPTAEMIGYNARVTDARYRWMTKWLRPVMRCRAAKGENVQLYLDVKVPDDARAGTYGGHVRMMSEHGPTADLPFTLDVLPLKLELPMPWGFFRYGWHVDTDENAAAVLRSLREMRWAGMTQCTISWQGGLAIGPDGTVDLSGYDRRLAIYREAGFPHPPVIGMERMLRSICSAMGKTDLAFDDRAFPQFGEEKLTDDIRDFSAKVMRHIHEHAVRANWGPHSLHLVDEISPGGKTVAARFLHRLWRKVAPATRFHSGIYTFDWWKQFDSPLDINTVHYVHPCNNEAGNRRWRALAEAHGTKTLFGIDFIGGLNTFWEGRQITLTAAKGVDGMMCWTQWVDNEVQAYEKNHGLDLDHFDPYLFTYSYWKGGPWAVHLRDGKTMRSTGWFGIREGIDDSRYLNTAKAWIEKTASNPNAAVREQAKAAALRLKMAMNAVPWVPELRHPKSTWTSESADKVRWICAGIAVRLRAELEAADGS